MSRPFTRTPGRTGVAAGAWMGAAIAGAIFSIVPAGPARADHGDDRRDSHRDEGRDHRDRPVRGHRYRVYAPPTVYYPPVASPGIRLVIPIDIH